MSAHRIRVEPAEPAWRRRSLPALASLLVLVTLFTCWMGPAGVELPEDLLGEWVSTSKKYEGSRFALSETSVTFFASDSVFSTYEITRSERDPSKAGPRYTIYYDAGNHVGQISLVYMGAAQAAFWFENQPDITWRKVAID